MKPQKPRLWLLNLFMLKISQIAYGSVIFTNRSRRWWILALGQTAGFFIIGQTTRGYWQFLPWLIAAVGLLVPVTVWLWLDMEAASSKLPKHLPLKIFIRYCLRSGGIMLCSIAAIILAKLAYLNWVFVALFSSLVAATAILSMLYVVLCGQTFSTAWGLALDTWHKKISLVVFIAFILILAHGASFAFVHAFWQPGLSGGEFSAFSHSATIWMLLAVLLLAIAYFAAVLNCFLVFLFLEIIRRKKGPDAAEGKAVKLTAVEAGS